MKFYLIQLFYLISRFLCKFLKFGFFYDWPSKKIVFGNLCNKEEVYLFLSSLWPKSIVGGLKRFGTMGDGGYLLPLKVDKINLLLSAGVEKNSDFEIEITSHFNCPVFMLDASVDRPAKYHKNFNFEKKWLGAFNADNFCGINEWIENRSKDNMSQIVLKIDIEGGEYEIFKFLNKENQKKLDFIICEFHAFENVLLKNNVSYRKVFYKILETHDIIHLHPNNVRNPYTCYGLFLSTDIEITFMKKNLVKTINDKVELPHKYDIKNTSRNDIKLNWSSIV